MKLKKLPKVIKGFLLIFVESGNCGERTPRGPTAARQEKEKGKGGERGKKGSKNLTLNQPGGHGFSVF